jgi:metal-responsive CopG/Arc/MetJ family transcriptional regulator
MNDKDVEPAPERIRFNFWLPRPTYLYLETIAEQECRSMSDLIREALRDYQLKHRLINQEKKDG